MFSDIITIYMVLLIFMISPITRFHSSVVLIDCWKDCYRAGEDEGTGTDGRLEAKL